MSFDESMIQLVDQRVRVNQRQTRALGTCIERDAEGPGCLVLFDGSTVAVPVKTFGHVMLVAGQRVGLEQFGTEWIVTGAFEGPTLGYVNEMEFASSSNNTSSGTYVDFTGIPSFEFTKYRETSQVKIFYSAMAFTNVALSAVRFGLRMTQLEGDTPYTPVDYNGPHIFFVQASHLAGVALIPINSGFPAGVYTVQPRWRLSAGGGPVSANTVDLFSIVIEEFIGPSSRNV